MSVAVCCSAVAVCEKLRYQTVKTSRGLEDSLASRLLHRTSRCASVCSARAAVLWDEICEYPKNSVKNIERTLEIAALLAFCIDSVWASCCFRVLLLCENANIQR
ncbi:hypothetical protein JTE90_017998 [Oedothorax gibbosus]|uniref:Secreted protein n=1 Tax=Oedothorax gibbosus TaxID=931172 RepID=A0AAV6V799_9ARAC|nr:hypothetical protein JTE90_017998 [Oedothorax gibbosus]